MNPLIQDKSGTTPVMSRNAFSTNQGTNEDDSQSDPHPEAGLAHSQMTQNSEASSTTRQCEILAKKIAVTFINIGCRILQCTKIGSGLNDAFSALWEFWEKSFWILSWAPTIGRITNMAWINYDACGFSMTPTLNKYSCGYCCDLMPCKKNVLIFKKENIKLKEQRVWNTKFFLHIDRLSVHSIILFISLPTKSREYFLYLLVYCNSVVVRSENFVCWRSSYHFV